ncbi:MAG: hypothetical protein KKH83_04055 [Candidatus Margulisbacteria bacterium]|nr:hypothetical protein [Candidatus Margulisiibacteriota bacterium]
MKKLTINNVQLTIKVCLRYLLIFGILLFGLSTTAFAAEYDGVFFMGFNTHKDIFEVREVRQAFNYAINREYIATEIASAEVAPTGIIPPGMLGYDEVLAGYPRDIKKAKQLMKEAGFSMSDSRIKNISLLHTDGVKTRKMAQRIKEDLADIGVKVRLKEVDYADQEYWASELESGRHHLFLMGYKASALDAIYIGDKLMKVFHAVTCPELPPADRQQFLYSYEGAVVSGYRPCDVCKPQPERQPTTIDLLNPLFHTGGSANLTYYHNRKVDNLLDEAAGIDPTLTSALRPKYEEINSILQNDSITVNLFYIEKL